MLLFATPFAQLDLVRQPEQDGEPLQAFDAADEYLLNQLHERGVTAQCRVLVLNDAFGALAASLAPHVQVTSSGDSHLGFLALRKNLARNGLDLGSVRFVPASETAVGPFDHVLVKVPKTLALLEEQLIRLHGQLAPGAQVVAAGMVKHLPRAAGDLLERYIGPMHASLAVKKARLLIAEAAERPQPRSPYPTRYRLEQPPLTLLNHANVFCREGLDIGTRAFLPHLPRSLGALRAADLGCGNGVLGIAYALLNPQAELALVDESYMAVQSARENWRAALGERPATFRADDGLAGQAVSTSRSTPGSSHGTSHQAGRWACSTRRAPWSPSSCASASQKARPNSTGWPRWPSYRGNTMASGVAIAARRSRVSAAIQGMSPSRTAMARAGLFLAAATPAARLWPMPDEASRLWTSRCCAGRPRLAGVSPARTTTRTSANASRARATLAASRVVPSASRARRLSLPKRRPCPAARTRHSTSSAATIRAARGECRCGCEECPPAPPGRFPPASCSPG